MPLPWAIHRRPAYADAILMSVRSCLLWSGQGFHQPLGAAVLCGSICVAARLSSVCNRQSGSAPSAAASCLASRLNNALVWVGREDIGERICPPRQWTTPATRRGAMVARSERLWSSLVRLAETAAAGRTGQPEMGRKPAQLGVSGHRRLVRSNQAVGIRMIQSDVQDRVMVPAKLDPKKRELLRLPFAHERKTNQA